MVLKLLKNHYLLILIFFVSLILRVHSLSKIPTGLHGDEASIGYNAYSILKTAHDQSGKFLPLAIDQFGDFRPAGYHYLDVPFVALFGLNELAVRLPSALFGSATIIVFFFLLLLLYNNKKIAYIGAVLLAFSSWHITISRASSEGIIAAFFILLGYVFFLTSLKRNQKHLFFIFISFLSFFISFLFYHSARFFLPLIFPPTALVLFLAFKAGKRIIIYNSVLFLLLVLTLFPLLGLGRGINRPFSISIFNYPAGTEELRQQIAEDGRQNPFLTRFYHNKLYFFGRIFLSSYFQHFDGDFLFLNNGLPIRYAVPWSGNLHLIELPFLILGFSILLTETIKAKKIVNLVLLIWLIAGAIPAGLTWEDIPNIQRSSFMIYALSAIVAYGIYESFCLLKGKINFFVVLLFIILFSQNILYFLHNYFHHSPIHVPWYRSGAVKDLVFTVDELSKNYNRILMTMNGNNNLIHHLFYLKFDPVKFQALGSPKEEEGLKFGKIIFTNSDCPLEGKQDKILEVEEGTVYVDVPSCPLPKNAEVLKTISHPDGIPAYKIVKLIQITE